MEPTQTPKHLELSEHAGVKPKRTAGEKMFGWLKYVVVGFFANVGFAYLVGRDMLLHEENSKAAQRKEPAVGKTLLPDLFHKHSTKLQRTIGQHLTEFIFRIPDSLRTKFDPEIYHKRLYGWVSDKQLAKLDLTEEQREKIRGKKYDLRDGLDEKQAKLLEKTFDNFHLAKHASENIRNGIALTIGGAIVSTGMYLLGKNRLAVVKKLDKLHDYLTHAPSQKVLAEREVAYNRISEEMQNNNESLWRILGTRSVALVSAIGTSALAVYFDPKRKGLERIEDSMLSNLDRLGQKYNFKLWFQDGDPDTKSPQERLFSLAFMEMIVGGYTSTADYIRHHSDKAHKHKKNSHTHKSLPLNSDPMPKAPYDPTTSDVKPLLALKDNGVDAEFSQTISSRNAKGDFRQQARSENDVATSDRRIG